MTICTRTSVLLAVCVSSLSAALPAQQPQASATAQVSFHFERPGVSVPKFTLTVDQAGNARYEADEVVVARGGAEADPPPTQHLDRTVTLSKATTDRVFATARALDWFNIACASKAKNIADTGKKTLLYQGPNGEGSCTYNYSDSKSVIQLTDIFLGIAATLDEGRELDRLHRYDRLGLDAAMGFLAQQASQGRALELGTIQATLRSIADDAEVMQRVRTRANTLLALVPAEVRTQ